MAEEITPSQRETCLHCGSEHISIHHREFPYQVTNGRKTLATGVLGAETTVCFKCRKTFVSESALPFNLVKDLVAGRLKIYNHTGMKTLVISDRPLSYAQTT